jgi:meso-butanediol dehydrogenase/(S,S)-butanediol dehydrogenase/diacetyl reductase
VGGRGSRAVRRRRRPLQQRLGAAQRPADGTVRRRLALHDKNELDIVWYSVRAAWPELVRRGGGSIVNVASIAAKLGARFVGQVPHGSAKGGVLAMTKHLCAAGGPLGIRANAILPGLIYTPVTARFIDDPEGPLPGILAKIPLGRYGHADEVAKLAAFLASDDAAFITGAEIAIDGGDGSVAA